MQVASELTRHNALEAHARDELGINNMTKAKPLQAAFVSALSFITGAAFPLLISALAPLKQLIVYEYGFSILFLAISGALAAKAGGSLMWKSVLRICLWGTFAMVATALVGYIFGTTVN
ncbi:MAG: VIT1/CCC1 transporter family protein [Cyclobacteriaceae bacterium]|nr:VIT1/CCC1 transporter family protein [Cyclobacteriaceae bacterium]